MANVKNFGLVGVGTSVQFGKAGPSLGQQSATILKADGTAAFRLPSGTTGQQPAAATAGSGGMRFNSTSGSMEYSDGSTWVSLATGGAAVTAVSVATANGLAGTSSGGTTPELTLSTSVNGLVFGDGTAFYAGVSGTDIKTVGGVSLIGSGDVGVIGSQYGGTGVNNGSSTITLGGSLTTVGANSMTITTTGATSVTMPTSGTLLSTTNIAANAVTSFQTDLDGLTPSSATNGVVTLSGTLGPTSGGTGLSSFSSGDVLYASGANTWAAAAPGSTSGVQAWDADLDALAGLTTTGYIVRTGAGTATTRAIQGTAGNIVVTNGSGVSSDTTIDLDTVSQAATGDFVKVTLDTFGRVTGNTAVTTADITGLVDSQYLRLDGTSTMAGNIAMGSFKVTGMADPTAAQDAATKNYVDNAVTGLSWKQAVLVATTANITLSGEQTIDGVTTSASRVLVKDQTDQTENGIYVSAAGAWARSQDANTGPELDNASVFVQQGTVNADSGWVQVTSPVTLGTSNIVWQQFSGAGAYVGGTGISISGNVINANLGAGIVELPSDEIGIDLYDTPTGALWLTADGTTKSTATGAKLYLKLAAAGGLTQDATGLYIPAAGVTNAMLVNDSIGLNGDTGTSSVDLGQTLEIVGDSVQGIVTSVAGQTATITASNASTTQKGVASFDTDNFAVTAGAVSIKAGGIDLTTDVTGTLPVVNGGTGATSFTATRLLIGDGTNPVTTDALLTFVTASNTLTVGTGTIAGTDGGDVTITATATDANINLIPNGTGAVVVGPAGAGLIQSDSGETLTVTGDTGLTLGVGTSGDITLSLPASNTYKVSVVGPTDAQYIDGLANNDLVTKYYVDTIAGSSTGDVKAVQGTVNLTSATSQNIGVTLPAGVTILSVKVNVTVASDAATTLVVGKSGGSQYMTAAENDPEVTGLYLAETDVDEAGAVQVQATVATAGTVGSAKVIVTYQIN